MLLNFWRPKEDPLGRIEPKAFRERSKSQVAQARRAALEGRMAEARGWLKSLLKEFPLDTHPDLNIAINLELARIRASQHQLPDVSRLRRFLKWLEQNSAQSPMVTFARSAARSELELVRLRRLRGEFESTGESEGSERELSLSRLETACVWGRRHPVVGLLNLQLASVYRAMAKDHTALDYLIEAHACFAESGETNSLHFRHEQSEVLIDMAGVAIDLGFLDQAQRILEQVLTLKDASRAEEKGGISLIYEDQRVTDRFGLARAHGLLAKVFQQQGKHFDALESYQADFQLARGSGQRGLYLNRTGQLFLDDGAYQMARSAFRKNLKLSEEQAPGQSSINRLVASLGLARTELLASLPDSGTQFGDSPRRIRQRTQARHEAKQHIAAARNDLDRLRETKPGKDYLKRHDRVLSEWETWFAAIEQLEQAHAVVDADSFDVSRFEEIRSSLLKVACQLDADPRCTILAAAAFFDLIRLEWWATSSRRYWLHSENDAAAANAHSPALQRLLDLWERQGARERINHLQNWCEQVGHLDGLQMVFSRYSPDIDLSREVADERKMTILFADLRDSCDHSKRARDSVELGQMIADLFRAIAPIAKECHGTILRYEGDSILIAFGMSSPVENHETNAVACALRVQKMLRFLNSLRQSCNANATPLVVSIGVHSGELAVANLMIPGKREVSVYGNAVNIAKRIQDLPKSHSDLIEAHFAARKIRRPEMVLVSADTLRRVDRGVFRTHCIGRDVRLKGYLDEPRDIYLVCAAVPTHTSFIGMGCQVQRQNGLVFLDVGNRAETGILDHHQDGIGGCAASLAVQHPDWIENAKDGDSIEIVVHAGPDFDCCAATFVALEVLEGRFASNGSAVQKPREALQALARYSTSIDRGDVPMGDDDPAASPYCLMAVVAEVVREEAKRQGQGRVESDREILEKGVQILHAAVDRVEQSAQPLAFERAFAGGVPAFLSREAELARGDYPTFLQQDRPRMREELFEVPDSSGTRRVPQRCTFITQPASRMFKIWARHDGFPMLVVEYPSPVPIAGTAIPLSRFVISVLPDSGLTLQDLAAELDRLEDQRRAELSRTRRVDLSRSGPPRPGFLNSDPWYDGRSVVLNHTIVDAPRALSVLNAADVLGVLRKLYAPAPIGSASKTTVKRRS